MAVHVNGRRNPAPIHPPKGVFAQIRDDDGADTGSRDRLTLGVLTQYRWPPPSGCTG